MLEDWSIFIEMRILVKRRGRIFDVPPWHTVEGSHEEVGDGEVEKEVVGDAPHGAVRQDDPQHHRVPHDGNHNDH